MQNGLGGEVIPRKRETEDQKKGGEAGLEKRRRSGVEDGVRVTTEVGRPEGRKSRWH